MSQPQTVVGASVGHAELVVVLQTLRLGVDPGELHGSLIGYLCAGGHANAHDWLQRLELSPDDTAAADTPLLQAFYLLSCAQIDAARAQIDPLLPADTFPLSMRADALVEWCRGFLGGFGLAGATARTALSAAASEVLADFATIAASRIEQGDEDEDGQAFAQVLAFVRMGSALLGRELSLHPRSPSVH